MEFDFSMLGCEKSPSSALNSLSITNQSEENVENNYSLKEKESSVKCVKCEQIYGFPSQKDDYLAHLYLEHRLVIADVEDIADLPEYLEFWVKEFKDHELEEYCTTMLLDQLPDGTPSKNEKYYLLSDILPKDYELRRELHTKRLKKVLEQHQFERRDRNFCRECLICRDVIKGLRADFLEHLFNKHFLQLGKPENLVFIDELIDLLQSNFKNLVCLYCEKVFKDRPTLKEHMRKRGHKRINPNIKLYDKFFLINYKNEKPQHVKNLKTKKVKKDPTSKPKPQSGAEKVTNQQRRENPIQMQEKQPQRLNKTDHNKSEENVLNICEDTDSDWSEWNGEGQILICLFCPRKDTDFSHLKEHMKSEHSVDFDKEVESLTFYQKVKVVNYVRRQIYIKRCTTCDEKFDSLETLEEHLKNLQHYGIGEKKQWDRPEFFFPTFEDDGLLCLLDDGNEEELDDPNVIIISEDTTVNPNKDAEALSLENFCL